MTSHIGIITLVAVPTVRAQRNPIYEGRNTLLGRNTAFFPIRYMILTDEPEYFQVWPNKQIKPEKFHFSP